MQVSSCLFLTALKLKGLSIMLCQGISTYDYIVAMREKDQKGIDGSAHSPTSPLGAVGSGTCGGISFLGIQGQTWCTTPRFLIDSEVRERESTVWFMWLSK